MSLQEIVVVAGLAFAACGHLLLHEVRGASAAWNWLDGHFPPSWRSAPPLAGMLLLALGTVGVLAPLLG
jgi:hypothetical protein